MAGASGDQALSLLAAANKHGDLAVKLSSLKQAKDILLSIEPSLAAEVYPYLVELQSSPESIVRKFLVETIEEIGLRGLRHSSILIGVILASLRDGDTIVASQSIISGTNLFSSVLEELTVQYDRLGKVERWLEELWIWMVKYKDAVFAIALENGSVGMKLLALKFLETFVLLFTSDTNDSEKPGEEAAAWTRRSFNVSWLVGGHPVLDPAMLMSEANRTLGILLNLLQSAGSLPGSLIIAIINCLAAIGRKRPQHYDTVLSALLNFDPNLEITKGCHATSIQYSLRTAFLGFLRCTHPSIMESRDRLTRTLRGLNAGDAADQVIRQVDKMIKNSDRSSRDARVAKDDQPLNQQPVLGEMRKRPVSIDHEQQLANGHEAVSKRFRSGSEAHLPLPAHTNDWEHDSITVNGVSPSVPLLDSELTPVEQMISVIGALLAEGERGAESLEILISKIHPDLLADIVITNMKHLPKTPLPLTRPGSLPVPRQVGLLASQSQFAPPAAPMNSVQSSTATIQIIPPSASATTLNDTPTVNNLTADSKRDPRRDPRRLDPRRLATGGSSMPVADDTVPSKMESDDFNSLTKPISYPVMISEECPPAPIPSKIRSETSENPPVSRIDMPTKSEVIEEPVECDSSLENIASNLAHSPSDMMDGDPIMKLSGIEPNEAYSSPILETELSTPSITESSVSADTCVELPLLPSFIELSESEESNIKHKAIKHIIESCKQFHGTGCQQMCMVLLARLVAQIDGDNIIEMLRKHVLDDQRQKGHELALHVLYHLHSLGILESAENSSPSAVLYEKFLLAVAASLLDAYPASDKSFIKLLGEVPLLPKSTFKLLNDLCYSDVTDHSGKIVRDVERVTQGLGAVWSLILGRPQNRQACLDIALRCAAHAQDEIRAKAIRLVANKLYQLSYISEDIEQFATKMLLSSVDQQVSVEGPSQAGSTDQRAEGQVESQETPIRVSEVAESATSVIDSLTVSKPTIQSTSLISFSEAQRLISLFFALCTKKPSLLQVVFDIYGQAPKTVKQAFHRHIPIVVRSLGQSYSKLLHIISDPPEGSENLLMLVLQILTQETTPSSELIATVRHLYETKFKDVTILVPILSSLSKNEVLPIFPRLVDLPLEKFQMALAHILQGTAHTGPALTPVEVLVAIHGIVPEKDGLLLKKIMDACSACFEQRTVFTQQVLAKALNQMVDQTPLPLLFMRTVIQAIDAFPTLVNFVMEILSKLVAKQVWRMPKLWVGFLKCISQTQPHSFHVLLQLPPPQLESALNKHANLRGPLAAYANQSSLKSSLPRSTLAVLGLVTETNMQQ